MSQGPSLPARQQPRQAGLPIRKQQEPASPPAHQKQGRAGKPVATTLKKSREFRRVYTNGRLVKGQYLWLYILSVLTPEVVPAEPATNKERRFGISVSKSRVKKATERNRIKRVIKAWCCQQAKAPDGKGYEAVIVVKKIPLLDRSGPPSRELASKLVEAGPPARNKLGRAGPPAVSNLGRAGSRAIRQELTGLFAKALRLL